MLVSEAIDEFLAVIEKSRSVHTHRAYANGINKLVEVLDDHGMDPETTSVAEFPDNRSAMRASVRVGNLINAQTHTLAAVEGEDFLKILSEV